MRFFTFVIAATLSFISLASHAEKQFPGIQSLMTSGEFSSAGLEKLSPEEIAKLNQWLISYTANEAGLIKQNVAEVKEIEKKDITSSIPGTFTGWNGKTVFKLANGQIWKQRQSDYWRTKKVDPQVTITQSMMGFYRLSIEGSNRSVGVKRIK